MVSFISLVLSDIAFGYIEAEPEKTGLVIAESCAFLAVSLKCSNTGAHSAARRMGAQLPGTDLHSVSDIQDSSPTQARPTNRLQKHFAPLFDPFPPPRILGHHCRPRLKPEPATEPITTTQSITSQTTARPSPCKAVRTIYPRWVQARLPSFVQGRRCGVPL